MKKHWLAVVGDQDLHIARIAVGNDKDKKMMIKILYHARFSSDSEGDISASLEAGKVKEWLKAQKVPLKELKLATSSLGLITRVITLPQMANEDLEKLITDHTDQYFTLNVDHYLIDYRILKKYRSDNKVMMDVLLAAFPKDKMGKIWALCKEIGFEPRVIDITADCMARVYSRFVPSMRFARSPESAGKFNVPGDIAIICLYRDKVEFVLLENNTFFLYSDLGIDIHGIAQRYHKSSKSVLPLQEERKHPQRSTVLTTAEPEDEIKLELSSYVDDEVELYKEDDSAQEIKNMPEHEKDYFSRIYQMNEAIDNYYNKNKGNQIISDTIEGIKPLDDLLWDDDHAITKVLEDAKALQQDSLDGETVLGSDLDVKLREQSELLNQLIGLENEYLHHDELDSPFDDLLSDETFLDLDNDSEIYELFPDLDIHKSRHLSESSISKYLEEMRLPLEELDFNIGFEVPRQNQEKLSGYKQNEAYKQAAIQIPSSEAVEETFVLEDLFVPFDQLKEELPITKNHQELEVTDDLQSMRDSLSLSVQGLGDERAYTPLLSETEQEEILYTEESFLPEIDFYQQKEILYVPDEPAQEVTLDKNSNSQDQYAQNLYIHEQSIQNQYDKDGQITDAINSNLAYPELDEFQQEFFSDGIMNADRRDIMTPSDEAVKADDTVMSEELAETEFLNVESTHTQAKSIFDPLDLNLAVFGLQKPEDSARTDDPREELENNLAPVLATLSELIGFFAARHYGHSIGTVYLTGDYADIPFLDDIFQANLGINTTVGFPNDWKPQFDKRDESLSKSWMKLGCLYGLALRED